MRSFEHIASPVNKTLIFAWYNLQSILDNHEITMHNTTMQDPESMATSATLIAFGIAAFVVSPIVGFILMYCGGSDKKCCRKDLKPDSLFDTLLDKKVSKAPPPLANS